MTICPPSWVSLRNDRLCVQVNPLGAELSLLRDAEGRDWLWDGDPSVWSGRAPVLFPIVGELHRGEFEWQGRRHALPRHGFARRRPFDVVEHGTSRARFLQSADDSTRAVYPFSFDLEVTFQLEGAALRVIATVTNRGDHTLPASLGFHPAFRWPAEPRHTRQACSLQFELPEPAPIRRLDRRGLLLAQPEPSPVMDRTLALHDALFERDVVIFDDLCSRWVDYHGPQGSLRVHFAGCTHLGLWSKPGAGFLCIEPWLGVADPVDFEGALDEKPGMLLLEPGARRALQMQIELLGHA